MASDMWSGWGIRTLSSDHVAYNPFSYHTGTVWPHDNAMIAGGFRRYGYTDQAARVAKGIFDAAERFVANRLPELFAGLPRQRGGFPVQYLEANVPRRGPRHRSSGLSRSCAGSMPRPDRQAPAVRRPGPARLAAAGHAQQPPGGPGCPDARVRRWKRGCGVEHERVRGRPRPGSAAGVAAAWERAAGGRPVGTSRPALNARRSGVSP